MSWPQWLLRQIAGMVAFTAIISPIPTRADESPALRLPSAGKIPRTVDEWRNLQSKVQDVAAKVLPAVVAVDSPHRIESDVPSARHHFEDYGSGVIIRADGLILSQWHVSHQSGLAIWRDPGDIAVVILQDGRRLKARLLGSDPVHDLSLLKIVEPGLYPYVAMAPASTLSVSDCVLKLGHPIGYRTDRGAVVRLGRVLYLGEAVDIVADCLVSPGDSGGPLVDLKGRLVGIVDGGVLLQSTMLAPAVGRGVEPFGYSSAGTISKSLPMMLQTPLGKKSDGGVQRSDIPQVNVLAQQLRSEFYSSSDRKILPSNLWMQGSETRAALRGAAEGYSASVVELLRDDRRAAYGTVVATNGVVVTKASELPETPRCRLPNGEIRPGTIVRIDAAFDLAILKIDGTGLRPVPLAMAPQQVGTIVAAPDGSGNAIGIGVVSVAKGRRDGPYPATVTLAPARGAPESSVPEIVGKPTTNNRLLVTHVAGHAAAADIRLGDIITKVDGQPITRGQITLANQSRSRPPGESLTLSCWRDGGDVVRKVILGEQPHTRCKGAPGRFASFRWNDFPVVFEHDIPLALDECGSPVVNIDGNTIGITIARIGQHGCAAVPADVIRSLVEETAKKGAK